MTSGSNASQSSILTTSRFNKVLRSDNLFRANCILAIILAVMASACQSPSTIRIKFVRLSYTLLSFFARMYDSLWPCIRRIGAPTLSAFDAGS